MNLKGVINQYTRTYHRAARCHFPHAQHHLLVKCGWPEDLRHQASTARFLRREFSSTEQHLVGLPVGNNKAVMRVHFSLRPKRRNWNVKPHQSHTQDLGERVGGAARWGQMEGRAWGLEPSLLTGPHHIAQRQDGGS